MTDERIMAADESAIVAAKTAWLEIYPSISGRDEDALQIGINTARKLLSAEAPPTCPAPIHGMTVDEWRHAISADYKRGETLDPSEIYALEHAARVAHRLAQPTPAVDPDKEAKELYKIFCLSYGSPIAGWKFASEGERNAWRAVAAAKAGKGE